MIFDQEEHLDYRLKTNINLSSSQASCLVQIFARLIRMGILLKETTPLQIKNIKLLLTNPSIILD